MPRLRSLLLLTCLVALCSSPVRAQSATPPPGPIYIVQQGDTLWELALRFHVSLEQLQSLNNLSGGQIYVGDQLVIPGLEELSGTLVNVQVGFGDSLRSLSRRLRMEPGLLMKLNHAVSPVEFYAGYEMVVLEQEQRPAWTGRASLAPGETLLELAVRQDTSPWSIALINGLSGLAVGLASDQLFLATDSPGSGAAGLPASILSAEIDPLPITQGQTVQIKLSTEQAAQVGGWLAGYELHFFPLEGNTQVALQGIHAMAEPGLYPLHLDVILPDGSTQAFEQMIMIVAGSFLQDPVLLVEPSTIDPAVTEPENLWLSGMVEAASPVRYWQGLFQLPVESSSYCLRSNYGNRRSYNGSAFIYFHTGVDYGVCSESRPFDIYAPAAGIVIYTGAQTVRGNATLIDHGWGVYSGIWHQAEILVSVGDMISVGQLIGMIGATGRATGAHLHWEVWVNGVQVDPNQWLEQQFPH